jgi:protein-L-isoaspartate(D-aspartate) O-methyltransferase
MYDRERLDLVEKLRKRGISDENVLAAIAQVERHLFVPDLLKNRAYEDVALPIGFGQTISQPYTVAFMTQALKVKKGDKILEIGTGSGYQAAILEKMGARVYSIERQIDLHLRAQKLFDQYNIRVATRLGDGTLGWFEFSPYDGIIVTAGSPTVPENLKKQLKIGGRLVIPVGDKKSQSLYIIEKIAEDKFDIEEVRSFAFVPLIGKEGWQN